MLFPVEQAGTTAPEEYAAQLAKRAVKLHKLTRDNLQQAQVRQKKNYDKNADKLYSFEEGDQVMLLVKVVPRSGMGKLMRAWRGPFTMTEVRQQGRYYILGEVIVAHYEKI